MFYNMIFDSDYYVFRQWKSDKLFFDVLMLDMVGLDLVYPIFTKINSHDLVV